MKLKKGELIGEKEAYYNDEVAFIIKNFGEDGFDIWRFNYDKENKKWVRQKTNPFENQTCHKERHVQLHKMLDELLADFIKHNKDKGLKTPIHDLMIWTYEQTKNPTE